MFGLKISDWSQADSLLLCLSAAAVQTRAFSSTGSKRLPPPLLLCPCLWHGGRRARRTRGCCGEMHWFTQVVSSGHSASSALPLLSSPVESGAAMMNLWPQSVCDLTQWCICQGLSRPLSFMYLWLLSLYFAFFLSLFVMCPLTISLLCIVVSAARRCWLGRAALHPVSFLGIDFHRGRFKNIPSDLWASLRTVEIGSRTHTLDDITGNRIFVEGWKRRMVRKPAPITQHLSIRCTRLSRQTLV